MSRSELIVIVPMQMLRFMRHLGQMCLEWWSSCSYEADSKYLSAATSHKAFQPLGQNASDRTSVIYLLDFSLLRLHSQTNGRFHIN